MPVADAFDSNIFGLTSLTKAINKIPRTPTRLGDMGIFKEQGITTTSVMIDELNGRIALVGETRRGAPGVTVTPATRTAREISVGHIAVEDMVKADDVIGIRAFGSETQEEILASKVNDRLAAMRNYIDVTREYRRSQALHGNILDSDGSTSLTNLFTEFGVSETTVDFAFTTATTDILSRCLTVKRAIEDAVGNTAMIRNVRAICGATWFDAFVNHAKVRDTYANWQGNSFLRSDNREGFEFGGIIFEEYRYTVSGVAFVNASQARFFPEADIYTEHFAPADYIETVNTIGLPMYAKRSNTKFDKGVELEAQSNPLPLCHLPAALIKGTQS